MDEIKEIERKWSKSSSIYDHSVTQAQIHIWDLLSKIKELEENRNYWAKVCKEAQELRDINGADLRQAESRIKELEAELQGEEQAHALSVYDLSVRIAGLERGIKKHRECKTNMPLADEELYRLIREKL